MIHVCIEKVILTFLLEMMKGQVGLTSIFDTFLGMRPVQDLIYSKDLLAEILEKTRHKRNFNKRATYFIHKSVACNVRPLHVLWKKENT